MIELFYWIGAIFFCIKTWEHGFIPAILMGLTWPFVFFIAILNTVVSE